MKNLPKELKIEILLHLPVKSLLRLKCVSKSWALSHLRTLLLKIAFSTIFPTDDHRFPYRVDDDQQMRSIYINTSLHDDSAPINLNFPSNNVDIIGSCRVFLLLQHRKTEKLLIWNPSTCESSKQIPLPRPLPSQLYYSELFGFCYNDSTDDHSIVLASMNLVPLSSDIVVLGFHVFSVRTNSWEKLDLSCQAISLMGSPGIGSVVNNGVVVHWFVLFKIPAPPRRAMKILAFDFKTKNLHQVLKLDDNVGSEY